MAKFDSAELYEARRAIRSEHERRATQRVQKAYGDKYNMFRMYDSKHSVAKLLNESEEERSVREKLQTIQKAQKTQQLRKNKCHERER